MATAQADSQKGEESLEKLLFYVKECYVYIIPPRRTAAAHRADDWNINRWNWEGAMKITATGDDCTIRLEDNATGELYAQAPLRQDQTLPVEAVADSSRFFVLRIEDNSSNRTKHAFIGVGFRERAEAYDFQVALYDHVACLHNKAGEAQAVSAENRSAHDDLKTEEASQVKSVIKVSPKPRVFDENFDISFLKKALPSPRLGRLARPTSVNRVTESCAKSAITGVSAETGNSKSSAVLQKEDTLVPLENTQDRGNGESGKSPQAA